MFTKPTTIDISMKYYTFKVHNELDFQRFLTLLDENQIPYTYKDTGDSLFPSVNELSGYGMVTVSDSYEKLVREILNEITSDYTETVSDRSIRLKKLSYRLMQLYMVVITATCIWFIIKEVRYSQYGHYKLAWNYDFTVLFETHRQTGSYTAFYDENFDGNYEKSREYHHDGSLISESFDEDENGYVEQVNFFSKGAWISSSYDRDDDNLMDEILMVLQNQDTLHLFDTNGDGFFEPQVKATNQ